MKTSRMQREDIRVDLWEDRKGFRCYMEQIVLGFRGRDRIGRLELCRGL